MADRTGRCLCGALADGTQKAGSAPPSDCRDPALERIDKVDRQPAVPKLAGNVAER